MEDQSETGLTDRPENGDHFEDNEDVEDDDSGEGELLIKSSAWSGPKVLGIRAVLGILLQALASFGC